jgi:hypothetical protein
MTLWLISNTIWLIVVAVWLYTTNRIIRKILQNQFRIYKYIEVLTSSSDNPLIKAAISEISKMSDSNLKGLNIKEFFSVEAFKQLEVLKTQIKSRLEKERTVDPFEKIHGNKIVDELNALTNLLGTLDRNSSSEYVQQVLDEVLVTLTNLREIGEE